MADERLARGPGQTNGGLCYQELYLWKPVGTKNKTFDSFAELFRAQNVVFVGFGFGVYTGVVTAFQIILLKRSVGEKWNVSSLENLFET